MSSPTDRKYSKSHEWHKLDGDTVTIGISQFAVDELTDITYVEFTETEGEISKGDPFGEIESVKATSEIYSGVTGEIIEVNSALEEAPETLNEDPYEKGWLIKIKASDPTQLDELMSAEDYDKENAS
jgi:glycine cleavage system H protein